MASSHEENWRRIPIKTDWKVPGHRDGKFMGVHKPRLMYGGVGNISQKNCVLRMLGINGRRVEIGNGSKIL